MDQTQEDQTLRVFELPQGKQQVQFKVPHAGISAIAFSPDGSMLVCGDRRATICLFDLTARKQLAHLRGHSSAISALVFSPDGKALASGSYDTTVLIWDVTKLKKGKTEAVSVIRAMTPRLLAKGSKGVPAIGRRPHGVALGAAVSPA